MFDGINQLIIFFLDEIYLEMRIQLSWRLGEFWLKWCYLYVLVRSIIRVLYQVEKKGKTIKSLAIDAKIFFPFFRGNNFNIHYFGKASPEVFCRVGLLPSSSCNCWILVSNSITYLKSEMRWIGEFEYQFVKE